MKLSSHHTVDAPICEVYEAIADFDAFEMLLSERGVAVARAPGVAPPSVGAKWAVQFCWRERAYDIAAELVSVDPGASYAIESKGNGIVCIGVVDVEPMSVSQTRLHVSFDFSATTFASKLLLQTIRLTEPSLNRRLDKRVADVASRIVRRA